MNCPFRSKPRWERRKEARPQELLAAALDVFVERGFAATRLGDVAALAGVSKGTLYLYFENKEELFKAVVRENLLPVLDEAEDIIDGHNGHSADLFREIIFGWWERIGATKLAGITKLMMAESGNFPDLVTFYREEVSMRGDAMIVRMLQRGVDRGDFRAINVRQVANVVIAPVIMLMMWQQPFNTCHVETISAEDYLNSFIDLCLNGLLSQPSPTQPDHGIC
ncbi:TetR/AcrR family transcriptional regulator [Collimonas arenae]|uniref:TetR/AcrR family transcriptional regulator n=1 Tax=Collimonas arenae TaxID=279058 RepID=UPI000778285F|nr:TetR/AcrR family transcriptional regulator [Collimonas arenae]